MGCRNRGFSDEENNTVSASLSDALLFTTMCIIGLPVDVHVKDGSIYSGIFFTACVDDDYAIVLKKARMIKKGSRLPNVVNGSLVETLIVQAEDLVQVVAKGVRLPTNGIFGDVDGDNVGAFVGNIQFPDSEAKVTQHNESNVDRMQGNTTRQTCERLDIKQSLGEEKAESEREKPADRVHGSSSDRDAGETISTADQNVLSNTNIRGLPSDMSSNCPTPGNTKLDGQSQEMHTLEETSHSNSVSVGASTDAMPKMDASAESRLSSSTASTESVLPKSSSCTRPSKGSKLNPEAKIFSPSLLHHGSATPAIPIMPSATYIPDPTSVVSVAPAEPEYEISPLVPCSSAPVKFVPYNNVIAGNGGIQPPYGHPVTGHAVNRIQPVKYAGPYHHSQAGPAFVPPNSQSVMVGRMGPLVYMHPLVHDVQTAAGFSQVSARPLVAPYQVYLPKNQGSAAAQALQLCMTPPLVASGQQPHALPGHSPISPPPFPVMRPILGPNGFLSTKLA